MRLPGGDPVTTAHTDRPETLSAARILLPEGDDLPDVVPVVDPPGWRLCFTCLYLVRVSVAACPVCADW